MRQRLTKFLIDLLGFARHGLEHRVRAESIQVCPGVVERALLCDVRERQVRVEFKLAGESLEDVLLGLVGRRDAEIEKAVEPEQRRMDACQWGGRSGR